MAPVFFGFLKCKKMSFVYPKRPMIEGHHIAQSSGSVHTMQANEPEVCENSTLLIKWAKEKHWMEFSHTSGFKQA
jgi:hypothetical protein